MADASQMLKSSGAMAAATMTSRLLGMVREIVYAAFMGNTWVASAFVLAFQVPNLFRRLLGEGALTAAFIPIFKQKEATEGEASMWRAANAVIVWLLISAGAITVIAIAAITAILALWDFFPERRLMLDLLRFMFPYMLLACLAAVLISMANARGHFFVPALGAAMLNVVMISSVLWLAPRMGARLDQQIYGLAIGVLVAGAVQAAFQLPALRKEGFRFAWVSPWKDPTVREVVRKMLPGSIGVAAFQINVLATQTFSYWVEESIVSTFNYAVRLLELPQGMFGISLATFMLPALSALAADKKYDEFRDTLRQGLGHLAVANLFSAAIAFALAEPIVRLLFERGLFTSSATHRVAVALACLAPGLLMFSMNNILARAFYALGDIQTPMRISVFCLVTNLALSFVLVFPLREAGLGVANTCTALLNTGLLTYALRRKLKFLGFATLVKPFLGLGIAALVAAATAGGLYYLWDAHLGHRTLVVKMGAVFGPAAVAGIVYWGTGIALKVPAMRDSTRAILNRLTR